MSYVKQVWQRVKVAFLRLFFKRAEQLPTKEAKPKRQWIDRSYWNKKLEDKLKELRELQSNSGGHF